MNKTEWDALPVKAKLSVDHYLCPDCEGKGLDPYIFDQCSRCKGTGWEKDYLLEALRYLKAGAHIEEPGGGKIFLADRTLPAPLEISGNTLEMLGHSGCVKDRRQGKNKGKWFITQFGKRAYAHRLKG